jgi:predicted metalloprotease with PDZ domain
MKLHRSRLVTLAILSFVVASAPFPSAVLGQVTPIRYELGYRRVGDSTVHVTIVLPRPRGGPEYFAMPRAIPMRYSPQPYDRFITNLVVRDPTGKPINLTDIDGPRWLIESNVQTPVASISYQVDLERMDRQILSATDASRVRAGFIGLLGYSVFGFVEGRTEEPIELTVRVPNDWPVTTTLAPTADSIRSFTVGARNYYALADAQIMGGPDLVVRRLTSAVPLAVSVYAEESIDLDTITDLTDRALRRMTEYFGFAPFPHFTASIEVLRPLSVDHAYRFSMEHLEGATFRYATGQVDVSPAGRDRFYFNLLHHMAHAWIPKRCATTGYYPFDWDYAAPIDGIWFTEGWSQYAAVDAMASEHDDAAAFRRFWAGRRYDVAGNDSAPPLAGRSTAELSRIAAHQYSDDFRLGLAVVSRGSLMAEAIDQRIRRETRGAKTFRDVARGLMAWCATSNAPVSVDALEQVVRRETGVASRDLIDKWLAPRGQRAPYRARP